MSSANRLNGRRSVLARRELALDTPPANQTWKVYYYVGAQTIAVRELTASGGNTLYFLHSDHLGSTGLTTSSAGTVVSQQWYYPYGAPRAGGGLPTNRTYTGQIADAGVGSLMFYNARYMSPLLGRFVSADTIVPEPGNPQSLNRFSYVYNSPTNYSDPTGHCAETDGQWDSVFDCTVDNFDSMPWNQRIRWMLEFMKQTEVETFKNVIGAIAYFRDDPLFGDSPWASLSDAGVLFAIGNGYNLSQGSNLTSCGGNQLCDTASQNWSNYFSEYERNGYASAYGLWGTAEGSGVQYGTALAEPLRKNLSLAENIQIDVFVGWGDRYRNMVSGRGAVGTIGGVSCAILMRCFGYLDPADARSGGFIYLVGRHGTNNIANGFFALEVTVLNVFQSAGISPRNVPVR